MITNQHISKVIAVIMAAAVICCFLAMGYEEKLEAALSGKGVAMEYEEALFDTEQTIRVDIQMEEESFQEMLQNAITEEYYRCDVTINGRTFPSVGIRPKGNTSLSAIAMDDTTDRFSLKLEFDHYVEGQTCFGLDKLILNNNYADASNMKEAVVYDMYHYLDADASLYNYAEIFVNGEYWGVYLALEAVEDSFMLRNYGTKDGELYKPDNMNAGGTPDDADAPGAGKQGRPEGERPDFQTGEMPEFSSEEMFGRMNGERPDFPNGGKPDFQNGGRRDFQNGQNNSPRGDASMNGNGADLNYVDDELDSYSAIWEGEVTNTNKTDHRRVVTALEHISKGMELEKYLDIDNILKYMAVHTFSVNPDSLSGTMAHNYYLYEYDGMLNILPWDYNLSFGTMGRGEASNASAVVNDAIDTPFQCTQFFDALLENEEYLERYHEYLRQLAEEYVAGGLFDGLYTRIRGQIDELVNTDPTAFYSYEEYEAGAEMLYRTVLLRAESVRGQISGVIPSTDEGQREDASNLIDASEIDIDVMGVMNTGDMGKNRQAAD